MMFNDPQAAAGREIIELIYALNLMPTDREEMRDFACGPFEFRIASGEIHIRERGIWRAEVNDRHAYFLSLSQAENIIAALRRALDRQWRHVFEKPEVGSLVYRDVPDGRLEALPPSSPLLSAPKK